MAELISEFLNREPPAIPHIIGRGILPVRGKMIIGGAPKANKSFVVLNMIKDLVLGLPIFLAKYRNQTPVMPVSKPWKVLLLEQEIGEEGLLTRLRGMGWTPENTEGIQLYVKTRDTGLRLDTPDGRQAIANEIAQTRPDVVFLDPMAKFHLSDENSAQEMGAIMRVFDHLIEEYSCAIAVVHHVGKENPDHAKRGGDRLRGSSAIFADVDTLLEVERKSPAHVAEPTIQLTFEMRRGEPIEKLFVKRNRSGLITYMGDDYSFTPNVNAPTGRRRDPYGDL